MKKFNQLKTLTFFLTTALLISGGQGAYAHTRLEVPQIPEGERVSNNVVTGHGCVDKPVIGTSVVFPDGVDSIITVDGSPHEGQLNDFVENWGNLNQMTLSRAVFTHGDEKKDSLDNVVGFWVGGGAGLPAHLAGFSPFRTSAVIIKPDSCAVSVNFLIPIVDICEITSAENLVNEVNVNLWTNNNLGTIYDRPGETDNGPASLTVLRASALPESCGEGVAVEVKPSAAQVNRDMPIIINGEQVWPQ